MKKDTTKTIILLIVLIVILILLMNFDKSFDQSEAHVQDVQAQAMINRASKVR